MNFLKLLLVLIALHCSTLDTHPAPQIQSLLAPQYARSIRTSDFSTGTVVITEPGYYVLTHDINFNPSCSSSSSSVTWPAGILILADGVTIDLNTHTLGQNSSTYNSAHFKLIQIGGTNIANTNDTTVYKPKHVTIKNGCLDGSQGYGIYGVDNVNVHIYDVMICNCDMAGIFLQNPKCSSIQYCSITGSPTSAGNAYGIFLRDNSATTPDWTSDSLGTSGPSSVLLENITICDIGTNNSLTTTALVTQFLTFALTLIDVTQLTAAKNSPGVTASVKLQAENVLTQISTLIALMNIAIFFPTTLNISNALTQAGTVNTQIAALITLINGLAPAPGSPDNCVLTATNGLQASMTLVTNLITQSSVIASGNKDYINGIATSTSWHAYGIRVTNGQSITFKNCHVTGTHVDQAVGATTHAAGIALDACHGCTLEKCTTSATSVNQGKAIGYSYATTCTGNHITSCSSTGHTSSDEVYGSWIIGAHCHTFDDSGASGLTGVTKTKGFYLELCSANKFKNCSAYCLESNLAAATNPGETIGFDSVGSDCNVFDACQSYDITADASFRNTTFQANLIGAGFRLRSYPNAAGPITTYDTSSVITNSTARCIQGSAGTGVGILLDGSLCATIRKNILSASRSLLSSGAIGGNGYGLWDTAANTTALIVENLSYANQTRNYRVTYASPSEQLPVVTSTYGDMTSLFVASTWLNISLQANAGTSGCSGAECSGFIEF